MAYKPYQDQPLDIVSEDPPFAGVEHISPKFKTSVQIQEEEDKKNHRNMYLLAYVLDATSDANDQVNTGGLVSIVEKLEQMGIETSGIKKCIEGVTGRPYKQFAADYHTNHREANYNVADFKGQMMPNGSFDSARAIRISQTDDAKKYECARGVGNILQGLGYNVSRDHATNWDTNLMRQGWVKLPDSYRGHPPEGAVLVYNSNAQAGKGVVKNGQGAEFGHVEIAVRKDDGGIGFLSDTLRNRPGGSVPGNFSGIFVSPQQAAELGLGRNAPQIAHNNTPTLGLNG